ncbi:DUF2726 domain-containing protein [Burkholderia ubonensis]|nr:DUF2726 domain-containing protein [Burkholderia ubonensis]
MAISAFVILVFAFISVGGAVIAYRTYRGREAAPAATVPAEASCAVAQPEFKATPILSSYETRLFLQLTEIFPDAWVFPQVSMAALMNPNVKRRHHKAFWASLSKIVQKRVDFAVYRANLTLLAVVELDDGSHDNPKQKAKDQDRDSLLASVGIPVVRFDTRQWPDKKTIRAALSQYLTEPLTQQANIDAIGLADQASALIGLEPVLSVGSRRRRALAQCAS